MKTERKLILALIISIYYILHILFKQLINSILHLFSSSYLFKRHLGFEDSYKMNILFTEIKCLHLTSITFYTHKFLNYFTDMQLHTTCICFAVFLDMKYCKMK